jgi:hypothetical protein
MIEVQYRPMRDTDWKRPAGKRKPSQFKSEWNATLTLLERELGFLKATDVTIELEVLPAAIRADGTGLKAQQRPASDAVIVSFETKALGTFVWRADAYTSPSYRRTPGWKHNVHAVAKTLEALRAVDRYDLAQGQQYGGFAALPAGSGTAASHMTEREAEELIGRLTGEGVWLTADNAKMIRRAKAAAHPDRHGGDQTLWDQVEQAARVLGVA